MVPVVMNGPAQKRRVSGVSLETLVRLLPIMSCVTHQFRYNLYPCQIAVVTTEPIIASSMLRRFPTKKYVLETSDPCSV